MSKARCYTEKVMSVGSFSTSRYGPPLESLTQVNVSSILGLLNLNMEENVLWDVLLSVLYYKVLCLAASFMSAPPCRDVVIEIEDTKPLLASKVGCIPDG